jgi:hypothetical protein
MGKAFESPEGKAVVDDAPNFLDMSSFRLLSRRWRTPLPT